jgi:hypothetical protein
MNLSGTEWNWRQFFAGEQRRALISAFPFVGEDNLKLQSV